MRVQKTMLLNLKIRCHLLKCRITQPLAAMLLAACVLPAMAQSAAVAPKVQAALTVELTQAKVVKGSDGKEQLVSAATVKPGDIIEYRAAYTNRSAKAVQGVVATLPIPEGLEYQPQSAKPGAKLAEAATKDKKYASEPLMQTVDGKSVAVPYADYRLLRWNLGQLPAGGEAAVSARAKVQAYSPAVLPLQTGAAGAPPSLVAVQKTSAAAKP